MVFRDFIPCCNVDDDLIYKIAHYKIIVFSRMGVRLACQDMIQPQGFVHLPHTGIGRTQLRQKD